MSRADRLSRATGRHPLANPVLVAVILLALVRSATGTAYPTFFEGAQFVHFLLGPATVALAVPLHQNWPLVKRSLVPVLGALVAGRSSRPCSRRSASGSCSACHRACSPRSRRSP